MKRNGKGNNQNLTIKVSGAYHGETLNLNLESSQKGLLQDWSFYWFSVL